MKKHRFPSSEYLNFVTYEKFTSLEISRNNRRSYITALIFRSKSADCDALISLALSLAILPKISVSRKDKSDFTFDYFLGFAL